MMRSWVPSMGLTSTEDTPLSTTGHDRSQHAIALERIAKGGEHGRSFLAKADVDAPDDTRSDHGPEPQARVHGEVPGRHVEQVPGHLTDVDEGGDLPVRVHVEEP